MEKVCDVVGASACWGNPDGSVQVVNLAGQILRSADAMLIFEQKAKDCEGGAIVHPEIMGFETATEIHEWSWNLRLRRFIHNCWPVNQGE